MAASLRDQGIPAEELPIISAGLRAGPQALSDVA